MTFNCVHLKATIGEFEVHQTWCNPVDICIVKKKQKFVQKIKAFSNERD